MGDVTKLKNRARREEQRENWSRAIELYTEALTASQKRADSVSDVSLYNRIGDIYLRIGQKNTAVRYYEEAIERYAEHELHASAIALCNKVLRIHNGRSSIFLQLGRLHLSTNLVADAHGHYMRYVESMREFGDDTAALEGLEELIEQTGDANTVELWVKYLTTSIAQSEAADRVEAFGETLKTHGFDSDEILARVRDVEHVNATTSPGAEVEDSESVLETEAPPLPPLEDDAADPDVVAPTAAAPMPEPEGLPEEEASSPSEEGATPDVEAEVRAEAPAATAESAPEPHPDSETEAEEYLEGDSTPWELDEEEDETRSPQFDESGVGGNEDWEPVPEFGQVRPLAEAARTWTEPFLEVIEPSSAPPHTVADTFGAGARDACEPPVFAPQEDEGLLVASGDGIERSIEPEPELSGVEASRVEIPEQAVLDPHNLTRVLHGQLESSEAPVSSGHPWVVGGPILDRAERSIDAGLTMGIRQVPQGEPCEAPAEAGFWTRQMPFGVERREGPTLEGFSLGVSPVQGVREFLASLREAPEGVISKAIQERGLALSQTLPWAPDPTDVTLPDMGIRDGLEEPGLARATESSEQDVPGPRLESIGGPEGDPTQAVEGGLEEILATHRDELAASNVEVEEETTDIAEAQEPVLEDADVEPFPIEAHEVEEVSSEPSPDPAVSPPRVPARSTDGEEPDVEVVDFDPAVSQFEVELPEPQPESAPQSVEPEPVAPLPESFSEVDGVAHGAARAETLEPAGDDPAGGGLSGGIGTPAPAPEVMSTGTVQATPAHDGDEEDAFREWVASASAPILRRALTELELRAELDKVLLVTERLLELDPDQPHLYRKRIEYLAAFGDQPLLVAAYIDLGVCLEQAGKMPEAVAAYEDLSRIDPGNAAAASALQRLQDVGRSSVVKQEEAEESSDPIDDMREEAAMGGGSSTFGYLHPDLVKSGILDSPTEEAPRPYSGVSGGRDAGADFEQLLSEFRQELHERPQKDSSLTRTQVGANLKAMGKLDDAIRELQTAVREPEAPSLAYELLGEAFLDKGQARVAMRLLKQALEDRRWDDRDMLGVLYQLGVSYQELGELSNALGCYERIFSVDIDYKDVQQRILSCS